MEDQLSPNSRDPATLVPLFTPRDPRVITPPVPVWKASGDADDAADAANEEANNEDGQAGGLRHTVCEGLQACGAWLCSGPADSANEEACNGDGQAGRWRQNCRCVNMAAWRRMLFLTRMLHAAEEGARTAAKPPLSQPTAMNRL